MWLIAGRYNIVDKPNHRSSHSFVTLRGGGVVYWMAALIFVLFNRETAHWLLVGGLTLIALISFYDDVKATSPLCGWLFTSQPCRWFFI